MSQEDIDRLADILAEKVVKKVNHSDICPFDPKATEFINRLHDEWDEDTWMTLVVMGRAIKRAASVVGTVFIAGLIGVVVWFMVLCMKKGWLTF